MNQTLDQALAGVLRSTEAQRAIGLAAEVNRLRAELAEANRRTQIAVDGWDAEHEVSIRLAAELDDAAALTEEYLDQLQHSMDANMRKRAHLKKLTEALARHRRPWWQKFLDLFQVPMPW